MECKEGSGKRKLRFPPLNGGKFLEEITNLEMKISSNWSQERSLFLQIEGVTERVLCHVISTRDREESEAAKENKRNRRKIGGASLTSVGGIKPVLKMKRCEQNSSRRDRCDRGWFFQKGFGGVDGMLRSVVVVTGQAGREEKKSGLSLESTWAQQGDDGGE